MAAINGNVLDMLAAGRGQLDSGIWVTGAGSTTYKHHGFVDGLSVEPIRNLEDIKPGNSLHPIGAFFTEQGWKIKGTMYEASLRLLQIALGGLESDVNVVTGTATLPLKEYSAINYRQVRLEIADQSMTPGYTEVAQAYVKRAWTFWRCLFRTTGAIEYEKGKVAMVPFEITAYYDSTVTESSTVGALGKVVDTTTGSYTA